jgi:hypothetical protein
MSQPKTILGGILAIIFGLLGAYCSYRALQTHRDLNGRPDINDTVRNWSTGAMACIVAAGVAITLTRPKVARASAAGDSPATAGISPVAITLILAIIAVIGVAGFMMVHRTSRRATPTLVQPPVVVMPSTARR